MLRLKNGKAMTICQIISEMETRGEKMQNCIEMLEEASGYLDDANSVIEQI